MPIQNAEDLFVTMLSRLYAAEQFGSSIIDELRNNVQNDDVKEELDLRAYLTRQEINNIEECFRLIGKQPMESNTRFLETWVDDVRSESNDIQQPVLKAIFILGKIRMLQHLHMAGYATLITMAYLMDNMPVATLLEHNLADKTAFLERSEDLTAEIGKDIISERRRKAA